jgi:hypothetical protein
MKYARSLILPLLALTAVMGITPASAADPDPYNLRLIQRGADGEPDPIDIAGDANVGKVLGFYGPGLIGPIVMSAGLSDGDKGDVTLALGVWTIDANAITTGKIADGAVTAAKIADGTITSAKIADGTIATGDVADSAVTTAKIADGTITNGDINPAALIALSKLATDPLARANHTGTQSADTLTDGTTNKAFLATERTKLAGVATGATANSADAVLLARANHTGTQPLSSLAQSGATTGQVSTWNGSAWVPATPAAGGLTAGVFTGTAEYAPGAVYSGAVAGTVNISFPTLTAGQKIEFDLDVQTTDRIVNFPAAFRNGYLGSTISTLTLPPSRQALRFYYNGAALVVYDSVNEPDIGVSTATTPAPGNNSTRVATTAYVRGEIAALPVVYGFAASDETTALTTGTGKVTFRMPHGMTLTEVRASVTTAPTGSTILVDINEAGTTLLSTKLMVDASEKTSTTAATAYVISDATLANDAEITIDIDQIGSSTAGAGLKIWLIGTR